MKARHSAAIRSSVSDPSENGLVLACEEQDNELFESASPKEGRLSAEWLSLLSETEQTFLRWQPNSQALHSFGVLEVDGFEDWLDRIHESDIGRVTKFFQQNWRATHGVVSIDYRIRLSREGNFETCRHTFIANENHRDPVITSLLSPCREPENREFQSERISQWLPFLDESNAETGFLSHLDSLRDSLDASVILVVELDDSMTARAVLASSFHKGAKAPNKETTLLAAANQVIQLHSPEEGIGSFLESPNEILSLNDFFVQISNQKAAGSSSALFVGFRSGKRAKKTELSLFASLAFEAIRFQEQVALRKESEAMTHQSQRLAGIGRLASGVAHDFNNLLSVIQGHTSFVETIAEESGDQKTLESVGLIRDATKQAIELSKQLLLFSRKDRKVALDECDLNQSVSSFIKMMRRMVEESIEIEVDLDDRTGLIKADSAIVGQILMNLIVNARDAMPGGGKIFISTEPVHLNDLSGELSPGDYISLVVRDTGPGIPPENLRRIFDPFYSTKGEGKGTGLGLANVSTLMSQHGGQINVSSVVGEGTQFELLFPQSGKRLKSFPPAKATAATPKPDFEQDSIRGSRVLLVEDEPTVRKLVRRLLEMHGCSVIEATSGKKALELWPDVCNEISVVVTDVIMPEGVSGWDLAKQLHAKAPHVGILLTSGYNESIEDHGLGDDPQVAFLQKPYEAQNLKRNIFGLLNPASA